MSLRPGSASAPASKSRSRPRASRNPSVASVRLMAQSAEGAGLPDGFVDVDTAQYLNDFAHPGHGHAAEETLVEAPSARDPSPSPEELAELDARKSLPWLKRPTPWWLIVGVPFTAIAMSASLAPRVEILTKLACRVHKPEYTIGVGAPYAWFDNPDGFGIPVPAGPHTPVIGGDDKVPVIVIDGVVENGTGWEVEVFWDVPDVPGAPDPDGDGEAGDPGRCARDPVVKAAVATLMAALSVSMGVLSCITGAWWGAMSDSYGRSRIMTVTSLGLLCNDVNFILVTFFVDFLPGNYWFLIAGTVIEGLCGGLAAAVAAIHGYVADTVEPADRSRFFSMFAGLMFVGVAFGPTLGALLIRATHSTISVFYLATAVHVLFALYVAFLLPESLTRAKMAATRRRAREAEARAGARGTKRAAWRRVFAFAAPLAIFLPKTVGARGLGPRKGGKAGKDWSLTLAALCYAFPVMVMGSYGYKMQYAQSEYGWTSEELGYFLSIVSASRALYLAAVLPLIIKFGTRWYNGRAQRRASASRAPSVARSHSHSNTRPPKPSPTRKPAHDPRFDLRLAQVSLVLDVLAFLAIPLAPSAALFLAFSTLASLGAGFPPALQAVTLELFARRGETETGKLFGAMSVLQALFGQVFGPAVFGYTFAVTNGTFPKAIFYLTAFFVFVSFVISLSLRLPPRVDPSADAADPNLDLEAEAGLVLPEDADEGEGEGEGEGEDGGRGVLGREETLVEVGTEETPLLGSVRGKGK